MNYPQTIMIIDEDREDIEIFCDVVHEINDTIQCIQVKEGMKALKSLAAEPIKPEYIFVDLNMTLINGKNWLSQIKKTESLKDIPVIIYSGSNSPVDIKEAKDKGASFYLSKPVQVSELKKSLSALFENRQQDFLL